MDKPKKIVVDCSTGAASELELTDEEIAQLEADAKANAEVLAQKEAEEAAKTAAKASALAKLTALGLSEAEAQTIVGN